MTSQRVRVVQEKAKLAFRGDLEDREAVSVQTLSLFAVESSF